MCMFTYYFVPAEPVPHKYMITFDYYFGHWACVSSAAIVFEIRGLRLILRSSSFAF